MSKEILLGKTLTELKEVVKELGFPAFTAKQLADWMYKKRIHSFDLMSNISIKNREKLSEQYDLGVQQPTRVAQSSDGTKKYLFQIGEDNFIESVYIPEKKRATLCVSIQVGCKMDCLFCMTGKQGFKGHLSVAEVLNQIIAIPESEKLTNIVFMGMGEPFDNINVLLKSIEIITADYGLEWSPKRITVSSIGVIPGLKRFLKESTAHLAISLHSPFDEERKTIMPIQKAFPIQQVIDEIRKYDFSRQRRISFEYIMFDELNDTLQHAKAIKKLLKGIDARVNLIRFHAIPNINLKTSNTRKMEEFSEYLNKNGVRTTIRESRGEDIEAACGMLSTEELISKNKERENK